MLQTIALIRRRWALRLAEGTDPFMNQQLLSPDRAHVERLLAQTNPLALATACTPSCMSYTERPPFRWTAAEWEAMAAEQERF